VWLSKQSQIRLHQGRGDYPRLKLPTKMTYCVNNIADPRNHKRRDCLVIDESYKKSSTNCPLGLSLCQPLPVKRKICRHDRLSKQKFNEVPRITRVRLRRQGKKLKREGFAPRLKAEQDEKRQASSALAHNLFFVVSLRLPLWTASQADASVKIVKEDCLCLGVEIQFSPEKRLRCQTRFSRSRPRVARVTGISYAEEREVSLPRKVSDKTVKPRFHRQFFFLT